MIIKTKIQEPGFDFKTFKKLNTDHRKKYLNEHLINYIANLLAVEPQHIELKLNLIEIGCDSIILAQIATHLHEKMGFKISLSQLFDYNSTEEFLSEIHQYISGHLLPSRISSIKIDKQNRYEPFELNEIQQAYWAGRNESLELGNVAMPYVCRI